MSRGDSANGARNVALKSGLIRTRDAAATSASAKLTAEPGSLFIHVVRHVGAADKGTAEDHLESYGEAVVAVSVELGGGDVGGHGEGAAGRSAGMVRGWVLSVRAGDVRAGV